MNSFSVSRINCSKGFTYLLEIVWSVNCNGHLHYGNESTVYIKRMKKYPDCLTFSEWRISNNKPEQVQGKISHWVNRRYELNTQCLLWLYYRDAKILNSLLHYFWSSAFPDCSGIYKKKDIWGRKCLSVWGKNNKWKAEDKKTKNHLKQKQYPGTSSVLKEVFCNVNESKNLKYRKLLH